MVDQDPAALILLTKLKLSRSQLVDLIVDATLNPRVSYDLDGQQFSYERYLAGLNAALDSLDKSIARRSVPITVIWLGTNQPTTNPGAADVEVGGSD